MSDNYRLISDLLLVMADRLEGEGQHILKLAKAVKGTSDGEAEGHARLMLRLASALRRRHDHDD